ETPTQPALRTARPTAAAREIFMLPLLLSGTALPPGYIESTDVPTAVSDAPTPTRRAAPIRALCGGIRRNLPVPGHPRVRRLPGASPDPRGMAADRPPAVLHRHSPGPRARR